MRWNTIVRLAAAAAAESVASLDCRVGMAWAADAEIASRPAATRTMRTSREVVRMGVLSFWVDVRHEVMGTT